MKRVDFSVEANGFQAAVEGYVLDGALDASARGPLPAVLICPGGGYGFVSDREAEPIALRLNGAGIHAFVLRYTVAPAARFPVALMQAAKTLATIRNHAEEWNIASNRIAVMGFSAGGHLAASLSTMWKIPQVQAVLAEGENARPDASVLCYPVISGGEFAHRASFLNLLGEEHNEQTAKEQSLEERVSTDTPPTFLWHTVEDPVVPVENSMMYAAALRRCNVPFEMHLYERGSHGLSTCTAVTGMEQPDCAGWLDLAIRFLQRLG